AVDLALGEPCDDARDRRRHAGRFERLHRDPLNRRLGQVGVNRRVVDVIPLADLDSVGVHDKRTGDAGQASQHGLAATGGQREVASASYMRASAPGILEWSWLPGWKKWLWPSMWTRPRPPR